VAKKVTRLTCMGGPLDGAVIDVPRGERELVLFDVGAAVCGTVGDTEPVLYLPESVASKAEFAFPGTHTYVRAKYHYPDGGSELMLVHESLCE